MLAATKSHALSLKVLILGGYGTFGGRLAQLLGDDARLTLVIAGRSHAKAAAFCATLSAGAELVPLAFDRDGDLARQLEEIRPDIVVDATGPFQLYGDDPYRLVRAAIAARIHYMDLADASDFVIGIERFDREARAAGIFVLSGASSFPVLTAAIVKKLGVGMRIDAVSGGIAPSPYAGIGTTVMRAIASYAGRPVTTGTGGQKFALTDTRRCTICVPGWLPLNNVLFSLVDVPDLQALPRAWPQLRAVWMGAGLVPEYQHLVLIGLAWLVRLGLFRTLAPLVGLMYRANLLLRRGEHRGGMFVTVDGILPDGRPIRRSWHMLAEGDDGPLIPSMAVQALVCRCLAGCPPPPGARPATLELDLDDYARLFERRAIGTGVWEETPATRSLPLYRRLLGEAWARLPPPLRQMHDLTAELTADGVATVERGSGLLARLAATLFGFPAAGRDIPVTVRFTVADGRETWTRTFGRQSFATVQEEGRGRFERLICERFGPVAFGLALVLDGDCLRLVLCRWTVLGIPMPLAMAPIGAAFESVEGGRFGFNVDIRHPLTGLIVSYRGWLVPRAGTATARVDAEANVI